MKVMKNRKPPFYFSREAEDKVALKGLKQTFLTEYSQQFSALGKEVP